MEKIVKVDPNVTIGREFRIPSIVGEGSGNGFDFAGLHLLDGWSSVQPALKEIDNDRVKSFMEHYCNRHKLPSPGKVKIDSETGVLREYSIRTKPVSWIYLSGEFPEEREGVYQGDNVRDLRVALALQRGVTTWMWKLWKELGYEKYASFVDGSERGYYSYNLQIPEDFRRPEKPVTSIAFQNKFELHAANLAGRFGLDLKNMNFDESGMLRAFYLRQGSACGYYLDPDGFSWDYNGHNVDRVEQVAVLHGIGADFINHLWQKKVGGYYPEVDKPY